VPAALVAFLFAGQASELASRVTATASQYQIAHPSDIFRLPVLQGALHWIEERVPVTAAQVQAWIVEGVKRVLHGLASAGGSIFIGALGMLVGLVLTLFLLFFFLRDGDAMAQQLVRIVPMPEQRKRLLLEHLAAVTKAVVFGTLVTAILQGALVGAAFAFVGLPSPVVFGAVAAACSLLPVGGTAFVWGPGAIALAVGGRWGAAVFLVAWGAILVSTIDNLLRPLFISGRAQISTLPVFFGVLGGLAAFGAIGMFLGPVLVALALALLRFAEEGAVSSEDEGRRT
jgi:predicted PurR-regulated permease PerM